MQNVVELTKIYGFRKMAQVAFGRELNRLFPSALRSRLMPSLHELAQVAVETHSDARSTIASLAGAAPTPGEAEKVQEEARRWAIEHQSFPDIWGIETETALFLYNFVRAVKPDRILETGVANGTSSYVILSALHANGHGRLVSTDIAAEANHDMPPHLAELWTFIQIKERPPEKEMPEIFERHAPYDMYFHDADHRYLGMRFEFEHAWRLLTDKGWFLSDDIDSSTAWIDFVTDQELEAIHLVDGRKVLGIARKGAALSFDEAPTPQQRTASS